MSLLDDVHFGYMGKPLVDWRSILANEPDIDDDEDRPISPDVKAILGFDPDDVSDDGGSGGLSRAGDRLIYLLSNAEMTPIAPGSRPTNIAGQPCEYFDKEIAHLGTFINPTPADGSKPFSITFTQARLDKLADTGNAMVAAGVKIPMVCDHKETAANTVGYAVAFRTEGGKLIATCQLIGDDAPKLAARNQVSVGVTENYIDGTGKNWGDAIRHVALTPVPVLTNMDEFLKAASRAAAAGSVLVLSAAEDTPMADKPNLLPCSEAQLNSLHSAVPGLVGVAPEGKADHLVKHLSAVGGHVKKLCRTLGMADPAAGSDDVQTLSMAVDATIQKLAAGPAVKTLSAAEVEIYVDRADLYRQKLDLAVANGDIDPTIAADLKAKLPADPKAGGVFLLSRANDNGFDGRPIDFILGLFNGKKLFATKGESTGVQHLSRAIPDDGNAANAAAPKLEDNPNYQTAVRMGLISTAEPKK